MRIRSITKTVDSILVPDGYSRFYCYGNDDNNKVLNFITKILFQQDNAFVFYYSGFQEDIDEIVENICAEIMETHPGKSKLHGFITKFFPAVVAKACDLNSIKYILSNWSTAVYVEEMFIVCNSQNINAIFERINMIKYNQDIIVNAVLPFVNAVIKTIPDSEFSQAFDIITNPQFKSIIENV